MDSLLANNESTDFNYIYDQVVPYGELLSSAILHAVLIEEGFNLNWLDVHQLLKTDAGFREAKINWAATKKNCTRQIISAKPISPKVL